MPVNGGKASISLQPTGEGLTEISMDMDMDVKSKFMQPMMYLMFKYKVAPQLFKNIEKEYLKDR